MNGKKSKIASIRARKGYRQKDIGEMIGVSQETISAWECGLYIPPYKKGMAYINIVDPQGKYGLTMEDFIPSDNDEEAPDV